MPIEKTPTPPENRSVPETKLPLKERLEPRYLDVRTETPEEAHARTINVHLHDGLNIMHALGPYQRLHSLEDIQKSDTFSKACEQLNAWAQAIEPAEIRKECALTLLYQLDWATGKTFLRFDEASSSFSFHETTLDRKQFEVELQTSIDHVIEASPALMERIRNGVKRYEDTKVAPPDLIQSLLEFVQQVEQDCPSLAIDLPGWAGNYMIDFLQAYKDSDASQRNCVRESQVVAQILKTIQSKGYLPPSFQVQSYGRDSDPKDVTLHDPNGQEENHVGSTLILGKDGQYFFDTWSAQAGKKGAAHANMKQWHTAFSKESKEEMDCLQSLQKTLTLPGKAGSHHPEHNVKWDFIFLKFFANGDKELPIPLHGMFEYMQKMCIHYVAKDFKQERAIQDLYNTPQGWRLLQPYVRTYFAELYPDSPYRKNAFR